MFNPGPSDVREPDIYYRTLGKVSIPFCNIFFSLLFFLQAVPTFSWSFSQGLRCSYYACSTPNTVFFQSCFYPRSSETVLQYSSGVKSRSHSYHGHISPQRSQWVPSSMPLRPPTIICLISWFLIVECYLLCYINVDIANRNIYGPGGRRWRDPSPVASRRRYAF